MPKWPEPGDCRRCPRLVKHRRWVHDTYPEYFNAPVGSWGDQRARLLIVGLAPGLHGAARTGRAFIGDASGEFLFEHLTKFGFLAPGPKLVGCRITNAVKCLPPQNAPTATEAANCFSHLEQELATFAPKGVRRTRVVLVLGGVAYRMISRALPGLPPFAHGVEGPVHDKLTVIGSYHPSRLNVNTGRLTSPMFGSVLSRAQSLFEQD